MRRVVLSFVLAAGLAASLPVLAAEPTQEGATPPAPTQEAPAGKKPKPGKDDPDRIVCERIHVVGSNRPQKVCMTNAERKRLHDTTQRAIQEQRGGAAPPGGPGQ